MCRRSTGLPRAHHLTATPPSPLSCKRFHPSQKATHNALPLHPRLQEEADRFAVDFRSRLPSARLLFSSQSRQRELQSERDAYIGDASRTHYAADIPFQAHELQAALSSTRSAHAEDRISYRILFHWREREVVHAKLLRLANLSYTSWRLTSSWKCAIIAAISKSQAPGQFRPISLLSCVGKTVEHMVLARLEWALGPLHHHLFAFRRGTSTADCLLHLLPCLLGREAVAVFLDLEKAFKLTSKLAILSILGGKDVTCRLLTTSTGAERGYVIKASFPELCSLRMAQHKSESSACPFSVLSLSGCPLSRSGQTTSPSSPTGPPSTAVSVRSTLLRVAAECAELGVSVNLETKAMAFDCSVYPDPLVIQGLPVEWLRAHRHLDILVYAKLTLWPYIDQLRATATSSPRITQALTRLKRGSGFRVLQCLYIHSVRTTIDNGSPCLITVPSSSLQPLETLQHCALRILLWCKCSPG